VAHDAVPQRVGSGVMATNRLGRARRRRPFGLQRRKGPPTPMLTLGIANGTTLTVGLFVNGQRVAAVLPLGPQPSIDVTTLPP
jgi:hypothetical protein